MAEKQRQQSLPARPPSSRSTDGIERAEAEQIQIDQEIQQAQIAEARQRALLEEEEASEPDGVQVTSSLKPNFPEMMMMLAAASDLLDFMDFSVVLSPFTAMASLPVSAALVLWYLNQSGDGNGITLQKGGLRLAATALVEVIPFVQILPLNVIFVWWVHKKRMEKYTEGNSVRIQSR